MSVAKLLLSGLLVASGLILGAFTLHARFAPEWEVQATAAVRSQPAEVPREPDRVAATDVPNNWAPRLVKVPDPKPDPKPQAAADPKTAEAKKKQAEKKKTKQEEPQTVFSWLSGLLNK